MLSMLIILLPTQAEGPAETSGPLAQTLAPVMMVAGVLVLAFFLVMSVRGRVARRQALTPSAREQIERIKARADGREDVHAATAQLVTTAQRLAAQLDAKAERLEQLIEQADGRIAALESHLEHVPDAEPAVSAAPHRPLEAEAEASPPEVERGTRLDPLTSAVYDLADSGHDLVDIARQLDEQIGKVELILALRDRDS